MKKFVFLFSLAIFLTACSNNSQVSIVLRNQCIEEKAKFEKDLDSDLEYISEVFTIPENNECLFLVEWGITSKSGGKRYIYDFIHQKKLDTETSAFSSSGEDNLLYQSDHERFEENLDKLRKGINPYKK